MKTNHLARLTRQPGHGLIRHARPGFDQQRHLVGHDVDAGAFFGVGGTHFLLPDPGHDADDEPPGVGGGPAPGAYHRPLQHVNPLVYPARRDHGGSPRERLGDAAQQRVGTAGGRRQCHRSEDAEVYNPATQSFRQVGDMLVYSSGHTPRSSLTAQSFCAAGWPPTSCRSRHAKPLASLPAGHARSTASTSPPASISTSVTGALTFTTRIPRPRLRRAVSSSRAPSYGDLLPNGKVLLAGGHAAWGAAYGPLASAELYDPLTDTFTWSANLTTTREYHSACLLPDGTVLLAGGLSSRVIPSR